jgi:outer membrane protein OmpA-like peptidoglycan-associated protein
MIISVVIIIICKFFYFGVIFLPKNKYLLYLSLNMISCLLYKSFILTIVPTISKTIIKVTIFLFSFSLLHSQDSLISKHSFQIIGGMNNVWNSTSLPVFPNNESCGKYKDGSGKGFFAGLNYGYDIFGSLLTVVGGGIYENRPVTLTTSTQCSEVLDPLTDSYVPFIRDHRYEGGLEYISLELGVRSKPFDFIPVSLQIVADAGNPIVNTEYTNKESISNQGVFYPDGKKSRLTSEGSITDAGTAIGATVSLIGEILVSRNWYITPQVSYRKSLNSVVSSHDWDMDIVRAGIGIMYHFDRSEPILDKKIEEELPQDTIPEQLEIPIIEDEPLIRYFSVDPVKLQETTITQTYPLLPYIFFDVSSAELKKQYTNYYIDFSEQALPKNTLYIYYNTLNIIGSRMKSNPSSVITLKGFTDGSEGGNGLAIKRAESVKKYLTDIWRIDGGRIKTESGNLPPLPTNTLYAEAFEENRRVEIYTDDMALLSPVIHSKFIEYRPLHKSFSFDIIPNDESKIVKSDLEIQYGNDNIVEIGNIEDITSIEIELDDDVLSEINSSGKEIADLNAILAVSDDDGKEEILRKSIELDLKTNDFEIGRLNLIVFDFDRSDITPINKAMIEDFIINTISNNSIVEITGSTDRLGEKQYNQTLSEKRAESVSEFISKISPKAKIVKVQGKGDSELLYDNDLPEGRFYCRTVLIEVKTPVNK